MRGRGAGSADGRNGRHEAVGNWGLGEAGIGQCHCRRRAASAILTNRTRPLSDLPCGVAEPEFSPREERRQITVYPFLAGKLSAFGVLCRKAMFCTLADLRQEVGR